MIDAIALLWLVPYDPGKIIQGQVFRCCCSIFKENFQTYVFATFDIFLNMIVTMKTIGRQTPPLDL